MSQEANPARVLMLTVAVYFDREDDRFVETLRQVYYPGLFVGLLERWKKDPRPWARQQVLNYLAQPLNVPGHHVIVKRLFKQAEERRDHEQMAAFLVAFDRLVRRERKKRYRYEWIPEIRHSQVHQTEYLALPRNSLLPPLPKKYRNPHTGQEVIIQPGRPYFLSYMRLFSARTRYYLRRRVWRYFRRLAHQQPAEYIPAVTQALARYTNDDLKLPEYLLDSRGLMQICFGASPALEITPIKTRLRPGHSMADLSAAPRFDKLWTDAQAFGPLAKLLLDSPARPVRIWARQLIERDHKPALAAAGTELLFRLFDHPDAELQQFAATLLASMPGVDKWPVETWIKLLELRDPTAQAIVCEQLLRHVSAERLEVAQTVQLASARATPVARIGLQFLRARKWDRPEDRQLLAGLGAVQCAAVGGELAKWALGVISLPDRYDREVVTSLFDSLLEPMRAATCNWFEGAVEAQDDPILWSRLVETPFEDLRLRVIEQLQRRAARPRIDALDLAPLWTAVLLGVHRGGRQKLKAVDQLVAALVDRPEHASQLLPVLGVAIRSVSKPEQRAGLAAVATLVERHAGLAPLVQQVLPDVSLVATVG